MFGSLNTATTGLNAAQMGLSVTGHNLANMNTYGYSRQQALQVDSVYFNRGYTALGTNQIGTGTDVNTIRQVRNRFLDAQYRTEVAKAGYYSTRYGVGIEMESILGELASDYSTQSALQDVWSALNELSMDPSSIAARGVFVSTCQTLLDKFDTVYRDLIAEQYNLDQQVRDSVDRVNTLVEQIQILNEKISIAESAGDNANDYRDARNLALDELSAIVPITYSEDENGYVEIMCEGNYLLSDGIQNNIGLRYTSDGYSFVEPVFTNSDEILPADNNTAVPLFDFSKPVGPEYDNDKSSLKAILYTRGTKPVTHLSEPIKPDVTDTTKYPLGEDDPQYIIDYAQYEEDKFNIERAIIPKTMKDLDTVFNATITLINDSLAPRIQSPDDPVGLDGTQHLEIFVRKEEPYSGRYDASGTYIEEDPDNYYSQYTMGNVMINPELMNVDGYDKIPLSNSGEPGDNTLILEMLETWNSDFIYMPGMTEPMSIEGAYNHTVSKVGNETSEAKTYYEQQVTNMMNLENNRISVSGVSMDEEMTNMIKFQHAYGASAKVVNIVDSMIDQVVNRMGRVGI